MKIVRMKEGKRLLLLFLLAAGFCAIYVLQFGVFGAKVDWISQHSVLPDYFRRQFYETGNLFPEFALNIGGGQNIYHFAYYGLYSPVILISYLLPFLKMSDYLMLAQFLCLAFSVLLMDVWLRRRGFSGQIAFGVSVMFLLAGPMIYHSYHQVMFVNYMPFLCMGFLGVDRYFEKKGKMGLLSVSILLMILTSFYFSIGGILVLILYGIHRYLEICDGREESFSVKRFVLAGMKFSAPFFLAVLMSGILLIPTAFALMGRGGSEYGAVTAVSLLLPEATPFRFFYHPYGIGLTTLAMTALAAMLFFRKWQEKVLAWGCAAVLTVPAFAYLLNGGLYVRDKAMIPFLPLLCYVVAYYLREMEADVKTGIKLRWCIPYLLTLFLLLLERKSCGKYWGWLMADAGIMLIGFLIFLKRKHILILMILPIAFLAVCGMGLNGSENGTVSRAFYREVTEKDLEELIGQTVEQEAGFYRIEQLGTDTENAANLNRIWNMGQNISSFYSSLYHAGYQKFRDQVFQLEEPYRNLLMQPAVYNPLFLRFMGVKYVVSKEKITGYTPVTSKGGWTVYQNDQASPIAYATDQIMPEAEYEKLSFPYNQLALLRCAVTEEEDGDALKPSELRTDEVEAVDLNLPDEIHAAKEQTILEKLPGNAEEERVVFIKFRVENEKPSKDVSVRVNGIRNKLTARNHFYYNDNTTFTYAVPLENGETELEITFGEGSYTISDAACWLGKWPGTDESETNCLYQSELQMDRQKTEGNRITGTIDVKKDGYFVTTIPYEKNFEILVDGKRTEGEKVNTAFLGFPVDQGEHEIEIIYHAPGVFAGKMVSLLGVILYAGTCLWERKKRREDQGTFCTGKC